MPWARLDDGYFTNRKVIDLSKDAKLLDLAAIAYSARELTDGELRKRDVLAITASLDIDDPIAVLDELITAGRWARTGNATWRIHDYLRYNPTREQVLRQREQSYQRVTAWREKQHVDADSVEDEILPAEGCNAVTTRDVTPLHNAFVTPTPLTSRIPLTKTNIRIPLSPPEGAEAKLVPKPIPKPKRERVPMTDQDTEDLVAKYVERYGTPAAVRDEIEMALNHRARFKSLNEKLYVDGWLRRELEYRPKLRTGDRQNGHMVAAHRVIDRTGMQN